MQHYEIWVLSSSFPSLASSYFHPILLLINFKVSLGAGDPSKVGLLKGLVPNHAHNRLRLFQADIYNPIQFEPAIEGCKYIFHMATPLQHDPKHIQV